MAASWIALAATLALSAGTITGAAPGVSAEGESRYIIEVEEGAAERIAESIEASGGTSLNIVDDAFDGVIVELDEAEAAALADAPGVVAVELDTPISVAVDQFSPPWGLDRIDQSAGPVDGLYRYPTAAGSGVVVYVIDTGVAGGLTEFGGRVTAGFSAVDGGSGATDCNGHGTHVAGTIASATYGVAKLSTVVPVRVMDCLGSGRSSDVIRGIDWVIAQHPRGRPGVINMSLGGPVNDSLDRAVEAAVAAGLLVVVAAGNEGVDACGSSPARVPLAITVAAVDQGDARPVWSNFGPCVDIFSPGTNITSVGLSGTAVMSSGTSSAAPHAAGAAANFWSLSASTSSQAVHDAVLSLATQGRVANSGAGTPNRMLATVSTVGADGGSVNGRFVNRLYADFIARIGTASEVESWSWMLATGQRSRYDLATELARSPEWISTVITKFYRDTLGREPDADGLRGWIAAAQSGMPVAQIASAFYASPEYFMTVGRGDHRIWVGDLYRKLLLREGDAAGVEGWVQALGRGMPRDTLTFGMYQSGETLGVRIEALYSRLLQRAPEAGAVGNWSPFVSNQGDLVLAAAIAGSDEYYGLAQRR